MFTQQKARNPSAPTPTPPPTPVADPSPSPLPPPSPKRPLHPPPPPPVTRKPQVPRKPQTKRVSFSTEEHETSTSEENAPRYEPHYLHDDATEPLTVTNDACEGVGSLLIRNRTPKPDLEMSRPVIRASRVLPADLIIPPPPLFDTCVSDVSFDDESERGIIMPPITVVLERIVLPEPVVAETSMQSSASDSTETEPPPSVNYEAYPELVDRPFITQTPPSSVIVAEVPSRQLFRSELPSVDVDQYMPELSLSHSGEPDPPALLHAQYGVLPSVSHVPNSPCHLHPDQTYLEDDHQPLHNSLRDLRTHNVSPGMVHSKTYPPINPYPSLSTVAGTYNPYTCTVPVIASNQFSYQIHKTPSPVLVNTIERNIAQATSISNNDEDPPKSVQLDRRVHFGEATMAAEPDTLSISSDPRDGSGSPAAHRPAWSSKVKAFAIGEVNISVRQLTLAHTLLLLIVFVDKKLREISTNKNKNSQSVIPSYPHPIFVLTLELRLLTGS